MKTISINLYSIDELSKEAQENAFGKYRCWNVENNYWYDFVLDDFVAICKTIGVDIAVNGIAFRGFWSQGDGSAFKSTINAKEFIEGVSLQKWKEYAPHLDFLFKPCPCDQRVIALLLNEQIECNWGTKIPNRGYWIDIDTDYYWESQDSRDFSNIYGQLEKLDSWIKEILNVLNRYLFKSLEEDYEYRTSDEALKETFLGNEYLFTADGRMADRLLDLGNS